MDIDQADRLLQKILEALDDLDNVDTFEAPKNLKGQRVAITREPWEGQTGTVVEDPYTDGPDYPDGYFVVLIDPPSGIRAVLDRSSVESLSTDDLDSTEEFEEPGNRPNAEIVDEYFDAITAPPPEGILPGEWTAAKLAQLTAKKLNCDIYDVINALEEKGCEEEVQDILETMGWLTS